MSRRELVGTGLAALATAAVGTRRASADPVGQKAGSVESSDAAWQSFRDGFVLDPGLVHMAGLLLVSHPRPVREAIAGHRAALDENPALYLAANNTRLEARARNAAAEYLDCRPDDVALTDSTTMGLALIYGGIAIRPDQEFIVTPHDYHVTHEAIRFRADRMGARVRGVRLYEDGRDADADTMVRRLVAAVGPRTRVVAITWVHSSTGVKVPVRRIADALAQKNAGRAPADRALLCVDGVHGLGVERETPAKLGADFFSAGTHKWMFGPRGTGIVWGKPASQDALTPLIPSFSPASAGWGGALTPGGFHSFEHRWALADAFTMFSALGRDRVTSRIHTLATRLKDGLADIPGVRLRTPASPEISAGIVCFEVAGLRPREVVTRLRARQIVASVTPYRPPYARLTPGLFNTTSEIDRCIAAVATIA